MALSGTLKDFGIADILQLIGHQTKTGRLVLRSGGDEVEVYFIEGNVVFATEKGRTAKNLLGNLLLRAELLSKEQLDEALGTQQRTLKRLGDILIEGQMVTPPQLAQMMRLQTTETLYRLFSWKNGSYEFSQEDVDPARSAFEPIRAESVLLEGFRRMDEWPALKKKVPWTEATFEKVKDLDTRDLPSIDDGGLGLDGGEDAEGKPTERHKLVFRLAVGGKDVQRVVDASRVGEFEALKAISDLMEWGFLKAVPPPRGTKALAQGLKIAGREPGPARGGGAPDLARSAGAAGKRPRALPDRARRIPGPAARPGRGPARLRAGPPLPLQRDVLLPEDCAGICIVASA